MTEPEFVTGESALLVGKTLVVSDLHIGIEHGIRKAGISIPTQVENMQNRIDSLLKDSGAERLVILGDVKHKVPGTSFQEEREVPFFFRHFLGKVRIEVSPGNHDPGLEEMLPKDVKVHPGKGFLDSGFYYCHGHAKPDPSFLKARYVIMGHTQPLIEFRDSLGYRWSEKAWVVADIKIPGKSKLKLVIMPAFNRFSGGFPVNAKSAESSRSPVRKREFSSPITRLSDMKKADIFLLDGTYLGKLEGL
jgi:putative SbcD/Mre11-related phosphoesterase